MVERRNERLELGEPIHAEEDGSIGYEVLCEFFPEKPIDESLIIPSMERGAKYAGLTVRSTLKHSFEPIGVTATIVLAESHATVSTWSEQGYLSIDVFSCTTVESCQCFVEGFCTAFVPGKMRGIVAQRPIMRPRDIDFFDSHAELVRSCAVLGQRRKGG